MNNYTIYCTKEQTLKALKLGALLINVPLKCKTLSDEGCKAMNVIRTSDEGYDRYYSYPTAEQMIGWLEEQGIWIHFCRPNQRPKLLSFSVSNINEPFRR